MRTEAQIVLGKLNKDYKVSDEKIADKLGVKSITIYRWRLGKTNPSFSELKVLKRIWTGHITRNNNS
jgi:transcriptional regulator with XRE-family HTH domain